MGICRKYGLPFKTEEREFAKKIQRNLEKKYHVRISEKRGKKKAINIEIIVRAIWKLFKVRELREESFNNSQKKENIQ